MKGLPPIMRITVMSALAAVRVMLFSNTILSVPGRALVVMVVAVLLTVHSPAHAGPDNAGGNILFSEHTEVISKIPINTRVIPDSISPYPHAGKVAYVIEGEKGFSVCMNDVCGPYVAAVARGMPVVSPDYNHWAAVVQKSGKSSVMLNGNMGRSYDRVASLRFSPDSMKVAYIAAEGDLFFVCVNQDRHPSFSLIEPEIGIVFSRDAKHMAYVARTDRNVWCVVKDGEPVGPTFEQIELLTFSPDGTRMVYAARQGEQWHIVEGDSRSPGYRRIQRVAFSPDSKSLAYIAKSKGGALVNLNGKDQDLYEAVVGELVFSPSGDRLAYTVGEKTKLGKPRMRFVVDGKPGKPFDSIGAYRFSNDGKQFSYIAVSDGKHKVVLGDVEQGPYDLTGIIPFFSYSDRYLAYAAKSGDYWHMIKNNKKGPAFDIVTSPVFAPQTDRMAYIGVKDMTFSVVVDDKILDSYLWAGGLTFSPDGRHLAFGAARGNDESGNLEAVIVIDGQEGAQSFLGLVKDSNLVFVDDKTVQGIFINAGGREFVLLRATVGRQ